MFLEESIRLDQKRKAEHAMDNSENQDIAEGRMNYYNSKARTMYFYMTHSTADFKG